MRGKDYTVLDRPEVQSRLHLPADGQFSRAESGLVRQLYDCPDVAVGPEACAAVSWWPLTQRPRKRAASVTPARAWSTNSFSPICRKTRSLPAMWWPSTCIVGPLNRCSPMKTRSKIPTAGVVTRLLDKKRGRLSEPRVWNLRLELGHMLEPTPMRTTEFALPIKEPTVEQVPVQGYDKPVIALPWKAGRFSGQDFALQPDGVLFCPAGKTLRPTEQRREADGSLRILYSARILDCRGCPKRPQCQWHGEASTKPRRISVLLHPLRVGPAPLRLRGIGVGENTGAPVCSSCDTNASR
jgi:hypothetical protein